MSLLLAVHIAQYPAHPVALVLICLLHVGHQILALLLQLVNGAVAYQLAFTQQHRTGDEALHLLQQMGGQQHGFVLLQNASSTL